MVWALSVTEVISYGVLYYGFAVFLVPVRTDLGASTAQVSLALTLSLAVTGLAAPLAGRVLDARGARALMTGGSLLGAASVAAWSQVQTLPQLYAAFLGIGLAGAAVLYEPAFAVVNTWFDRERSTALLTLTVVAGFSSTVMLPTAQALTGALGWRHALLVLAGLMALCAVPHALLLRHRPAGATPIPTPGPDDEAPAAQHAGALRGRREAGAVRWLTAAAVLETIATTVVAVHLIGYLTDAGTTPATAAAVAGSLGALQVAGRVALTAAAARVGLGRLAAAMVAGQAVGVAALFALPAPASVVVFVLLFGAGFGVMTITRPALLGRYVQRSVFARASGRQALFANTGSVVAPLAAGAVIGTAGYGAAFTAVAVCVLLAAAALLGAERAHARSAPRAPR